MSAKACHEALCAAGERLDPILAPLGYVFEPDEMIPGVPLATALFVRGKQAININYSRSGTRLGVVMYVNAGGGMHHDQLMRALGLADRQLLAFEEAELRSFSHVGGDPIDALIADLTLAAPALQDPARMDELIARNMERHAREHPKHAAHNHSDRKRSGRGRFGKRVPRDH
ncbi:MAG TPA: hypothetical protein VEK57_19570 [Thermoanaerobaculia bacterium]|nr:hypothetical protein [Thermoanaerobaculia bacterium]